MGQMTIYLDDETERLVKRSADAAGMSRSRWVVKLLWEKTAAEWPESFRRSIGSWEEGFPEVAEIRAGLGEDLPRQDL